MPSQLISPFTDTLNTTLGDHWDPREPLNHASTTYVAGSGYPLDCQTSHIPPPVKLEPLAFPGPSSAMYSSHSSLSSRFGLGFPQIASSNTGSFYNREPEPITWSSPTGSLSSSFTSGSPSVPASSAGPSIAGLSLSPSGPSQRLPRRASALGMDSADSPERSDGQTFRFPSFYLTHDSCRPDANG
jgi:hypothetical protein